MHKGLQMRGSMFVWEPERRQPPWLWLRQMESEAREGGSGQIVQGLLGLKRTVGRFYSKSADIICYTYGELGEEGEGLGRNGLETICEKCFLKLLKVPYSCPVISICSSPSFLSSWPLTYISLHIFFVGHFLLYRTLRSLHIWVLSSFSVACNLL